MSRLKAASRRLDNYRGRFAPSPSGELHLGSLVTALASYLQAKTRQGVWLIRIDDIDTPRVKPGSAAGIIQTLQCFGLEADEPVSYQSQRLSVYAAALAQLEHLEAVYPCGCSRADLNADGSYPGTCRSGLSAGKSARSIRIKASAQPIQFEDLIAGPQLDDIQHTGGDFVLHRADGIFAYQLCAAIDDACPHITEVVRGADLLTSTGRQRHIQSLLQLQSPRYAHIPVVTDQAGKKLSKHSADAPLATQEPAMAMRTALTHLRHPPPQNIRSTAGLLQWALDHWDIRQLIPGS